MPKKGGKGKKKKEDEWGSIPREQWITLEVKNSAWQTMRFLELMSTKEPLEAVRAVIIAKHRLGGEAGLRLFRGDGVDEENLFKSSDYAMSLDDLKIVGGSKNDTMLRQVITYDYAPFQSILNLPRETYAPPVSGTAAPAGWY